MKNANSISAHAIADCGLFVVSTGVVSTGVFSTGVDSMWRCRGAVCPAPMPSASSLDPRR